MIDDLLTRNRRWAVERLQADPAYFSRLIEHQAPAYFWIGCSDSRVPANVITGLDPGEVFVHRNVANVVHSSDMSLLSALEFAVEALGVRDIIMCGHYGCGGVRAACEDLPHGLADHWLAPIRRLAGERWNDLAAVAGDAARLDRLAELNVRDGVHRLAQTPILRKAWRRGDPITVHGVIYGLCDGLLRDLECSIGPAATGAR
jgi:carbonic anhydrase